MNYRIKKLRQNSLDAKPKISHQRAVLLTEFYKTKDISKYSIPEQRALSFKYILENKDICISKDELIVGERGEFAKSTPTYPEICLHTIDDLNILNSREKVSFSVSGETKNVYKKEIIPFWKGKTIREKIFSAVSEEWKNAYTAGVFTEFQEQRAPGHTVLGGETFKKGFFDIKKEINTELEKLKQQTDNESLSKKDELKAMKIVTEALVIFAKRHSEKVEVLLHKEKDAVRISELKTIKSICQNIPAKAPQTFWEALQHYWFIHLGVITELNPWDSFNPGRLDQHLLPFYQNDLKNGVITKEKAKELLQSFWIKFNNHPSPPKMGVTAKESNTYTDFSLINLGGLKEDGNDAVNELTYLILDVIEEMRLLQPGSMIQVSKKNPDKFIKRALEIVKTGFGQPSIFNTDEIIKELQRQGKSLEDARNGGASGCVETGAFGKESYILTGYFNLPKVLEITLNNGVNPKNKKLTGIKTGNPEDFKSFNQLLIAFEKQLKYFAEIKIEGNKIIEQLYSKELPVPFLSILIDDCIKNGKDYNSGGAKYNTSYIQGVGLGSITDELSSIKYNIYDKKNFSFKHLLKAMKNNFRDDEKLRKKLVFETPKYGNDDDYADDQTKKVFEIFFNSIDGKPNTKNGYFRINLLPTTSHMYFGSVTGAMPDGRKDGEPLSEGISPVQGADTNGPTSVLKSASKIDHTKTGGTLLNQKFAPQFFKDETGKNALMHLIRAYFKLNGHHIQFNVVNAKTLKMAKSNPEKYKDLIVRVAGYSDYFIDLTDELQDEIIRRTEHESM